jgi:hypothetical protein
MCDARHRDVPLNVPLNGARLRLGREGFRFNVFGAKYSHRNTNRRSSLLTLAVLDSTYLVLLLLLDSTYLTVP